MDSKQYRWNPSPARYLHTDGTTNVEWQWSAEVASSHSWKLPGFWLSWLWQTQPLSLRQTDKCFLSVLLGAADRPQMSSGFAVQGASGSRSGSRGFGGGGNAPTRRTSVAAPQVETNATAVRKSEVNELRGTLNTAINSRDGKAIYSALERVLAAMTIGLDVSDLFHNVIMVRLSRTESFSRLTSGLAHSRPNPEKDGISLSHSLCGCQREHGFARRQLDCSRHPWW